jgi:hypothetical protein
LLFGYPIAATNVNWLHECLFDSIRILHDAVDAGVPYPDWPNVLPMVYRVLLASKSGLRDRLSAYDKAIRRLSQRNRDAIIQAMESQNRIPDLLSCACDCPTIEDLPKSVRAPLKALFDYAYDRLKDFGLRDPHYNAIYAAIPEPVCPFCGTEPFEAPGLTREDLDHYLPKSLYPFAAANLRNLVPMGNKCNTGYKKTTDLLRRTDKMRRTVIDPYIHTAIVVSLNESEPFDGDDPDIPKWQIEFEPDSPAVATWDEVFRVRDRYRHNHLNRHYKEWLDHFRKSVIRSGRKVDSDHDLIEALRWYEDHYRDDGLHGGAFLRAAVFCMLRIHCENGDQRLLKVIKDLVAPSAALTAMAS